MNEKLQYAEMLEIPVNSCSIKYKPSKKKKKFVASENAKEELIEKINTASEVSMQAEEEPLMEQLLIPVTEEINELQEEVLETEDYVKIRRTDKKEKKRFKLRFNLIGLEIIAIAVLLGTILLTNTFMPNSAINTFMKKVFGSSNVVQTDTRVYSDFSPSLPIENADNISIDRGVMSFNGGGSLYSPCDGVVTGLVKDAEGSITIEITHSENFKTVFSGLDFAYCALNESVYSNVPVGYVTGDDGTMCFYDGFGESIKDFTLESGTLKWA